MVGDIVVVQLRRDGDSGGSRHGEKRIDLKEIFEVRERGIIDGLVMAIEENLCHDLPSPNLWIFI